MPHRALLRLVEYVIWYCRAHHLAAGKTSTSEYFLGKSLTFWVLTSVPVIKLEAVLLACGQLHGSCGSCHGHANWAWKHQHYNWFGDMSIRARTSQPFLLGCAVGASLSLITSASLGSKTLRALIWLDFPYDTFHQVIFQQLNTGHNLQQLVPSCVLTRDQLWKIGTKTLPSIASIMCKISRLVIQFPSHSYRHSKLVT